jgi:excinuclease UvrABC nuclease subunit
MQFNFEQSLAFERENAAEILRGIPVLPGVFALCGARVGEEAEAQPYLTRAADLRRRITRMLAPPEPSADGSPAQSKRLNLRGRVARIEYTVTGSEFESTLVLYRAAAAIYGVAEARRRLRLHTPFFLRFTAENAFPRVYSTNRLSRRGLAHSYGPFPSRAAADRYADAVLDHFKLRRCSEELAPAPEHPGCVYQEMKKCLAPCNQAHRPEGAAAYAAEASAVERFFETRGESLLTRLAGERERASAELDFERAAELHAQVLRVKAAAALADPLVQPIAKLRAVIVQQAARTKSSEEAGAAIFLVDGGSLVGPERLTTGAGRDSEAGSDATNTAAASVQARVAQLIDGMLLRAEQKTRSRAELDLLSDHLSLLRRWYYRPEKQRVGEVFLPKENGTISNGDGLWPILRIARGAARMVSGDARLNGEPMWEQGERDGRSIESEETAR